MGVLMGGFWFRPAIVPMPKNPPPDGITPLGLFGYTLGGVVCLEYDVSPVGPYIEYVTMGALVSKRGALGQWGSRLFVSTDVAEEVCVRTWGVPAEVATMSFNDDDDDSLGVEAAPGLEANPAVRRETIDVNGWAATRHNWRQRRGGALRRHPGVVDAQHQDPVGAVCAAPAAQLRGRRR